MSSSDVSSALPMQFETTNYNTQLQSSLFAIPGEIRDKIFAFTLAEYEDLTQAYELKTFWSRPEFFAPRKCDTALLRTCKRAYSEAWFRPWVGAQHTFWLTSRSRAPGKRVSIDRFKAVLQMIRNKFGIVEVEHVRFFAQLWALEKSSHLDKFIKIPNFNPRCITVTLRHTDWWYWEGEQTLCIDGQWVNANKLPTSLREFRMELETLEKRKAQLDSVARQMRSQWYFTREDGMHLFAKDEEDQVIRWQGSSTLSKRRWIRDETKPGRLDYYVRTVVWRADPNRSIQKYSQPGRIKSQVESRTIYSGLSGLPISYLDKAGITDEDTADVALQKYRDWAMTPVGRSHVVNVHFFDWNHDVDLDEREETSV